GRYGVEVDQVVDKLQDDQSGPTAVDLIASGEITLVVNTPTGSKGRSDGEHIRKAASLHRVSCFTTVSAALAAVQGMEESLGRTLAVRPLQEYHSG
ncbi:MAG: hypothetical protein ACPHGX_06510, partial [Ilumatobacteraceae bacterium]